MWMIGAFALFSGLGCSVSSSPDGARTSASTSTIPAIRPGSSAAATRPGTPATVVRIVDGDTLVADVGGREERVRLIGIDTPETVDPRKPVQCFGREASAYAAQLLPPGTSITLVADVEPRDRYQRTLSYVYRNSDNLFVNLALVNDGYARLATYPPNVAHVEEFRNAEQSARTANRGLWSAC